MLVRGIRNLLAVPAGAKPGFDSTHPAARNCLISAVYSSGSFIDLLSGITGTISGTGYTKNIHSTIGASGNFANNTNAVEFTIPSQINSNYLLASIFTTPSSISSTNHYAASCFNGVNTGMTTFFNSSGFAYADSNTGTAVVLLSTIAANTPYFFAVSGTSNLAYYAVTNLLSGQTWSGSNNTGGTFAGTATKFDIGNRTSDGLRPLIGNCAAAMVASSADTNFLVKDITLKQWAGDPWSFWYPQILPGRIAAASAAVTWLEASGSSQTIPPRHWFREVVGY